MSLDNALAQGIAVLFIVCWFFCYIFSPSGLLQNFLRRCTRRLKDVVSTPAPTFRPILYEKIDVHCRG